MSENHGDHWLVRRASWEDLCISSFQFWAICSPPHCQGTFGSTKRCFHLLQLNGGGGRCSYWHLEGRHQECCQIILQNTRNYLPPNISGKNSDAGKDWEQEEKGTTKDKMAGWHHWLDGRESQWTPGVGDGQGGLACCNSWGHKESDMTERLNWTETSAVLRVRNCSILWAICSVRW